MLNRDNDIQKKLEHFIKLKVLHSVWIQKNTENINIICFFPFFANNI